MDFYVDYSCEDNKETGRTKLTVSDFDTTSIRDVKYAIQAAIQAPVCDQQLFYQGQPVTDDDMTLSRLYFREGDCFKVKFLAAVDITRMTELVDVLRNFAQEIVEKLNRQLPVINTKEEPNSLRSLHDFFSVRHKAACLAIKELQDSFFAPWKCLKTVAQRHFFVQEGGFEAFLEVFKFSSQIYQALNSVDGNSVETTMIADHLKHVFNQSQLYLQTSCHYFLWDFGETPQDRKFLLSKDVFPLAVNSLLLQPSLFEDYGHNCIARRIVDTNESALGPFGTLVEYDAKIQENVSQTFQLIDKLLFIIDRCQSEPAGYSLISSQTASDILLFCTWNVRSAQPLVDCGALEIMLTITQKLLIDKDSDAPLRYNCCLILARLRSAPLVKLDEDTCVVIDELVDAFLEEDVVNEISQWEEDMSCVWMTMVPFAHLVFAAGKEYYCNQIEALECDTTKSKEQINQSSASMTEFNEAEDEASRSDDDREEGFVHQTGLRRQTTKTPTLSDTSETIETKTLVAKDKNCVTADRKDQFTWPGSPSTQKLGIFSLTHMLLLKENQQLVLAQNLLPYLVCLSWHLKSDEEEKLKSILANFRYGSTPPSLKVAAKSVLALVNGLDMVYEL